MNVESLVRRFLVDLGQVVAAQVLAGRTGVCRPARARRTAGELHIACDVLLDAVRREPGARIEQLAKGMGVPSASLTKPMQKLLAAGRVRKAGGVARGTTYKASR